MEDGLSSECDASGRDPEDVAADVADFVADFLEDEAEESVRPLTEYLRRFPNSEPEIAVEYLRLCGQAVTLDPYASQPAGPSSTAGGGPHSEGDHQRVAHYRLIRLLGSGGQGEVWLALDEILQRRVALKLLTAIFVTEERRERFRREAESIARLEHPGLAQVHDADIDGSPPFIAMRYVEGVDLGTSFDHARARADAAAESGGAADTRRVTIAPLIPWIPSGRAELHAVLRFFERCARALHAAHEAGVLHRDVKPGNIMVTAAGGPVLLDFGLARGEEFTAESALTREGDVFGTLAYMAPEQLRGESSRVDARSDVWALGVTLFEALVGERPFQGRGPGELAIAIDSQPVPDASSANPTVTADVRVVLETALDRSPDRRYASSLALAEDLRRIAEYEPIRARPAGPLLRFRRWCRREPAWAAALAVTLVALVGGLIASLVANKQMRALLDSRTAQQYVAVVPTLAETAPAGALALGLETVELEDTWRTRSALFGPLLDTTLRAWFRLPEARVWDAALTSSDGAVLGGAGGAIERVDFVSGRVEARASVEENVRSLVIDAARSTVWAGTSDGRLVSLEYRTLREIGSRKLGTTPVIDIELVGGVALVLVAPTNIVAVDLETGREVARRELGTGVFGRLEVSADLGHVLVSPRQFHGMRRATREVLVFAIDGLTPVASFLHPVEVHDMAVATESDLVATVDAAGTVRLFDLQSGLAVTDDTGAPLELHHGLAGGAIALSSAGDRLVVGLDSKDVEDAAALETILSYRLRPITGGAQHRARTAVREWSLCGTGRVVDLAFAPRSVAGSAPGHRHLATASWDNSVRILDSATGALVMLHREYSRPNDLRWSPDGEVLVSIGTASSVEVWRSRRSPLGFRFDGLSGNEPGQAGATAGPVWGAFSADGERVVLLDEAGRAGVFDAPHPGNDGTDAPRDRAPGALLTRLDPAPDSGPGSGPGSSVGDTAGARAGVADDSPTAYWVGPAGRMRAVHTMTLAAIAESSAPGFARGALLDLDVAPDGRRVVCVDAAGQGWSWSPGSAPTELPAGPLGPLGHARLDRTGSHAFVATVAGRVARVSLDGDADGDVWLPFVDPDLGQDLSPLTDLQLSPDGRQIVAALGRDRLVFWDTDSGEPVSRKRYRLRRERVTWLDDERVLAIGTGGGAVQVIGLDHVVIPSDLHDRQVSGCAGSLDGQLAATSSVDGSVLVWDTRSGETLGRSDVHGAPVHCVQIDGTGRSARVLSCSDQGAAVWPIDVLPAARRLTVRQLTSSERRSLDALRLDDS